MFKENDPQIKVTKDSVIIGTVTNIDSSEVRIEENNERLNTLMECYHGRSLEK